MQYVFLMLHAVDAQCANENSIILGLWSQWTPYRPPKLHRIWTTKTKSCPKRSRYHSLNLPCFWQIYIRIRVKLHVTPKRIPPSIFPISLFSEYELLHRRSFFNPFLHAWSLIQSLSHRSWPEGYSAILERSFQPPFSLACNKFCVLVEPQKPEQFPRSWKLALQEGRVIKSKPKKRGAHNVGHLRTM